MKGKLLFIKIMGNFMMIIYKVLKAWSIIKVMIPGSGTILIRINL